MESLSLFSIFEKALPVMTFFAGYLADWAKQELFDRKEEKKLISRVIADLLDLRFKVKCIIDLPQEFAALVPKEFSQLFPPEIWRLIDIQQMLPSDDGLVKRYREATDEISATNPLLSYQLRGKESYFDLRSGIFKRFEDVPAFSFGVSEVTAILDKEYLPAVDEMILLLAEHHSPRLHKQIKKKLKEKTEDNDSFPPELKAKMKDLTERLIKSQADLASGTKIEQ